MKEKDKNKTKKEQQRKNRENKIKKALYTTASCEGEKVYRGKKDVLNTKMERERQKRREAKTIKTAKQHTQLSI